MSGKSIVLNKPEEIDLSTVQSILTPANCVSANVIKSFLTFSRKFSDYNIHVDIPRTGHCDAYIEKSLFPAWEMRDFALEYCSEIADKLDSEKSASLNHEQVDPRLDPYANRDASLQLKGTQNSIKTWVSREKSIEDIIRHDSIKFLKSKCGPSLLAFNTAKTRLLLEGNGYENSYQAFRERANQKH